MVIDESGALWLADPWFALVALVGAVALVVWCHSWLERGRAPLPRELTALARARLGLPRRSDGRPSMLTATVPFRGRTRLATRPRQVVKVRRNAA